jgi:hypothetical protein
MTVMTSFSVRIEGDWVGVGRGEIEEALLETFARLIGTRPTTRTSRPRTRSGPYDDETLSNEHGEIVLASRWFGALPGDAVETEGVLLLRDGTKISGTVVDSSLTSAVDFGVYGDRERVEPALRESVVMAFRGRRMDRHT